MEFERARSVYERSLEVDYRNQVQHCDIMISYIGTNQDGGCCEKSRLGHRSCCAFVVGIAVCVQGMMLVDRNDRVLLRAEFRRIFVTKIVEEERGGVAGT